MSSLRSFILTEQCQHARTESVRAFQTVPAAETSSFCLEKFCPSAPLRSILLSHFSLFPMLSQKPQVSGSPREKHLWLRAEPQKSHRTTGKTQCGWAPFMWYNQQCYPEILLLLISLKCSFWDVYGTLDCSLRADSDFSLYLETSLIKMTLPRLLKLILFSL